MSNNPEISQETFLRMRERWQPCVDLMPFFDYCAAHVLANQYFHLLEIMCLIQEGRLRFAPSTRLKLWSMRRSPRKVF